MEDVVKKEKSQGRCKAEGNRQEGRAGAKIKRAVFGGWGDILVRTQSDCTVKHISQGARIATPVGSSTSGLAYHLPAICLALPASCFLHSRSFSLLVFSMLSGANAATGPLIWLKSYWNQTHWEIIFNEQKRGTEAVNSTSNTTKKDPYSGNPAAQTLQMNSLLEDKAVRWIKAWLRTWR